MYVIAWIFFSILLHRRSNHPATNAFGNYNDDAYIGKLVFLLIVHIVLRRRPVIKILKTSFFYIFLPDGETKGQKPIMIGYHVIEDALFSLSLCGCVQTFFQSHWSRKIENRTISITDCNLQFATCTIGWKFHWKNFRKILPVDIKINEKLQNTKWLHVCG